MIASVPMSVSIEYLVARPYTVGRDRKPVLPALRGSTGACRSGIESLPTVAGKIGFYPGVGVFRADYIVSSEVVELVAAKAVDHPRRNSEGSQHDGHGRSEVLAVPLLALEKKIRDGIFHGRARQLQRVTEVSPEIVFDGGGFVEIVTGGICDLGRQSCHSGIDRWQPKVSGGDPFGVIPSRGTQLRGSRGRDRSEEHTSELQ